MPIDILDIVVYVLSNADHVAGESLPLASHAHP
jgi:hypothetical protein